MVYRFKLASSRLITRTSLSSVLLLPVIAACCSALFLPPSGAASEDPQPFDNMSQVVAEWLEHDYYDQKRFQPHVMVDRALRWLRTNETSIQTSWTGNVITLTVDSNTKRIPASEPQNLEEAMALIEAVRLAVDASGFKPDRARELDYDLINGALMCLDPHTVLMPPESAKEFREDMDGRFYGIGAFLNQEEGLIRIERVMPGLPADRAGVEDGDIILGIDGERTAGLSLDQAVHRIKGPKGSQVILSVERKSVNHNIDLPITRDLVQLITLQKYRAGDVGYVRMDEFNQLTDRDLAQAIESLNATTPMKAFILDLRFNGGGLLDQAKKVSNFFLPRGVEMVRTVTIDGQPQISTSSSRQILDIPMVVLTSGLSASAAEIVSGALQRNDRAVIVGSTTFGKGSVQTIRDLTDGSRLKLTIQEYQLPGGVSIQDVGVLPDIKLVQHTQAEDGHIDIVPYPNVREADEEFALKNQHVYAHTIAYELGWLAKHQTKDELKLSGIASRDFRPDQESQLVIDLLKQAVAAPDFVAGGQDAAKSKTSRQFLIEQLRTPVAQRSEAESAALAAALMAKAPPIVWGPAATAAPAAFTLTYTGHDAVSAGKDAELTFTLANNTDKPVGRMYGVIKADKLSPWWESEVIFGEVPAGKSTTGTLTLKVPPRLYTGEERFELDLFHDGENEVLATTQVRVQVVAQPRPHFSYKWQLQTSGSDAQLHPDEADILLLTLSNDGDGPSDKIDLRVYKDNDPYVQLGETRIKLDPLPKDGSVTVKVPLKVLKQIKHHDDAMPFAAASIKLQVRADEQVDDHIDGRYRAMLFNALIIPVNAPLTPQAIIQPFISLDKITSDGTNRATVSVKVVDSHLHFMNTFQDEDKIDMQPAAKLVDGTYTFHVTLKPGANTLRIVALDKDEVEEVLPLRLWGEGEQPTAVGPTAAPVTGTVIP